MIRLLKAVERGEHSATRREVNWTKVQADVALLGSRICGILCGKFA
jgi:hypothetical protein